MELNFDRINSIGNTVEALNEAEATNIYPQSENALEGQIKGLQRILDKNKADAERSQEVYRAYQENIKLSSQLQTEILKGANNGESIYSLFLKAVKAISCMTSNTAFYNQLDRKYSGVTEELNAIYTDVKAKKQSTEEAFRNEADNALNLNFEYVKTMERYIDKTR